jgi:hypothetical protein
MQIKSFTYTKANGTTSSRVAMIVNQPTNMFMAIDLSELDVDEQAAYAAAYSSLLDEFKARVADLDEAFDTKNRIRQFDPLKMTDCTEQWIGSENI